MLPSCACAGKSRGYQGGDLKKVLFVSIFLLTAMFAAADTLFLTGLPGFTYNGYYVGPATGNLNDGTSFALVCNDFTDTSYIPSSFTVNVSTIPELQYALFAGTLPTAAEIGAYEQAAILMWQMGQPGNQTAAGIGGIQFAIWNLFYPAAPDPGTSASLVSWAQSQDLSAWDYGGVSVYTPTDTDSHNQEFMSGAASPVPEPTTFGLVGSALLGAGLLIRRWRMRV